METKAQLAAKIVAHIDRACELMPVGSPEHAAVVKEALLMEWPVIRVLLVDMNR